MNRTHDSANQYATVFFFFSPFDSIEILSQSLWGRKTSNDGPIIENRMKKDRFKQFAHTHDRKVHKRTKAKTKKHMLVLPKFYSMCSCALAHDLSVLFLFVPPSVSLSRSPSLVRFSLCCVCVKTITFIPQYCFITHSTIFNFCSKFTHAHLLESSIKHHRASREQMYGHTCARGGHLLAHLCRCRFANGSFGIKCGCCADTRSPQARTQTVFCSELCQREQMKKNSAHFPANLVHVCRLV